MKTPSKIKLALDLILGGFMLGAATLLRPYDSSNLFIATLGGFWIYEASITLNRHFS